MLENSVGWEEEVRKVPVGPHFVWDSMRYKCSK